MKFVLSALFSLFFLSLLSITKQATVDESCDYFKPNPVESFKINDYLGRWYVRFLSDYEQVEGLDCIVWNYNDLSGDTSYVTESSKNLTSAETQNSKSKMVFDTPQIGQYTYDTVEGPSEPEYVKILATDYSTYSIEFSCVNTNPGSECYVYAITREAVPSQVTIDKINAALKDHNINEGLGRYVEQGPTCGHPSK